tara:strand:- start:264 stop:614 length:351 start_codon:yes stop_codon:yes gene_type:complete
MNNVHNSITSEQLQFFEDDYPVELDEHTRLGIVHMLKRELQQLAHTQGRVSSDDAYQILFDKQIPAYLLGRAAGTLFKSDEWIKTSEVIKSRRPSNHQREIPLWRLRDKYDDEDIF